MAEALYGLDQNLGYDLTIYLIMLKFHVMKFVQTEVRAAEPSPVTKEFCQDTQETLRAVRRIARALALSSRELARRHELTAAQLLCLRALKDRGALSAGALAKTLSLSPQTTTGLVDRLEARGLVERLRSPSDRRSVLIRLSESGSAIIEAAGPMLQDRFVASFDALAPARRRELRRALETVVSLLEADTLDAAPLLDAGHRIEPASPEDPRRRKPASQTRLGTEREHRKSEEPRKDVTINRV